MRWQTCEEGIRWNAMPLVTNSHGYERRWMDHHRRHLEVRQQHGLPNSHEKTAIVYDVPHAYVFQGGFGLHPFSLQSCRAPYVHLGGCFMQHLFNTQSNVLIIHQVGGSCILDFPFTLHYRFNVDVSLESF